MRSTEIFAGEEWYDERPEPEHVWKGSLRRRESPRGPDTRATLTFGLVMEERELAVYAANVEGELAAFVDRPVVAQGKLVDLGAEGFGRELWIASIVEA